MYGKNVNECTEESQSTRKNRRRKWFSKCAADQNLKEMCVRVNPYQHVLLQHVINVYLLQMALPCP